MVGREGWGHPPHWVCSLGVFPGLGTVPLGTSNSGLHGIGGHTASLSEPGAGIRKREGVGVAGGGRGVRRAGGVASPGVGSGA